MAQKITLQGKEYSYRLDFGAMLNYEQLSAKIPQEAATATTMSALMHYCCLLSDESFTYTYEEFLRSIDTQQALNALTEAGEREQQRWLSLNSSVDEESANDDAKKK